MRRVLSLLGIAPTPGLVAPPNGAPVAAPECEDVDEVTHAWQDGFDAGETERAALQRQVTRLEAEVAELKAEKARLVRERNEARGDRRCAQIDRDNAAEVLRRERATSEALRVQLRDGCSAELVAVRRQAEQDRRNCIDMQQRLLDVQREKDLVDLELLWVTNGRRVSAEGRARLGVDS